MSEPTYVGMPGRGESNQLRLTITQNATGNFTECTVRIPDTLIVEAWPIPPLAAVGDDWIELSSELDDPGPTNNGDGGFWNLEPEGLAMKFLRLAWLCAHDEVMRKRPR